MRLAETFGIFSQSVGGDVVIIRLVPEQRILYALAHTSRLELSGFKGSNCT